MVPVSTEPELHMHPLITIDVLGRLTDADLLDLEARLRNFILTADLSESDLRRCLASLSNAIYVLSFRTSRTLRP